MDPIPRLALTADGVLEVEPATLVEHVLLDRHWESVAWFFATGDCRPLSSYRRMAVADIPLATDAGELRAWPGQVRRRSAMWRGVRSCRAYRC
jgi:hypothetical protein